MSSRHLDRVFRIAIVCMVAGTATLILSDILQRPILGWIAMGVLLSGGVAGMVGGAAVMAETLRDEDQ